MQKTHTIDRPLSRLPGAGRRFGVMLYPDVTWAEFERRARWLEDMGFDLVVLPDHIGDLRDLSHPWYVTDSALPVLARATTHARIGTLVSNPILRTAANLARQATAVQDLSGGRLELGVGTGLFDWDHAANGTVPWSVKEHVARFEDYVEIVSGIVRNQNPSFTFEGEHLFARDVPTAPPPISPPTLVIAGQSPTVLRIAARFGDVWNTIGPMGKGKDEVLERTATQNATLDRLVEEAGRRPSDVIRSIAAFGEWDPFVAEPAVSFDEWVEAFSGIGMTDFIVGLPQDESLFGAFEATVRKALPALREER